jgi:hypothetical protein
MNYLKIAFGVLIVLSLSRFVPHPPNFTSLLTLSFYIPAAFGIRYIPTVIISLVFTDFIIGFHSLMIYTLSSIIFIGLISKFFNRSILFRLFGALSGAVIFYSLTNFGVWLNGSYDYSLNGLIACYILALPFFGYTLISTLIFSLIIETLYIFYKPNKKTIKSNLFNK